MTGMTSLNYIVLVHFVTTIAFAFSLNSTGQTEIKLGGHITAWYGFENFHIVRSTLAHAETNYHVSQYGHGIQETVDM